MASWDSTRTSPYTFSNNNQTIGRSATTDASALRTLSQSSGKWVISFVATFTGTSAGCEVGFGNTNTTIATYLGSAGGNSFGVNAAGTLIINDTTSSITGYAHVTGDQIDVAIDITNKVFWIRSTSHSNWNGNATYVPGDTHGVSFSAMSSGNFTLFPGVDAVGSTGATVNMATPPTVSSFPPWESAATANTSYYVDNSIGSDTNDGLAPTVGGGHGPWASIAHVNSQLFGAGDRILFNGSQTFGPAATGIALGPNNFDALNYPGAANPVVIGSYGGGGATVSVNSNTVNGVLINDVGGVTIQDLILTGPSSTTSTVDGVFIQNNANSGSYQLPAVIAQRLTVSLFGRNGVFIYSSAAGNTGGFNAASVLNSTIHDCCGGVNSGSNGLNQTAGIQCTGSAAGASNATGCHASPVFSGNTVYNCTGKAAGSSWTGSGIVAISASNPTLTLNIAHDCGANSSASSGPVGIWAAYSTNPLISFCEVYNQGGTSTTDAGGFDLEECSGGIIEYCYAHNNAGYGALLYSFTTTPANTNNTIRYCIFRSNNQANVGGEIVISNDSGTNTGCKVYNNTLYNTVAGHSGIFIGGTSAGSMTGNVANNIIYVASGNSFVDFSASATANPTGLVFDGNNYYTTGTFSLKWYVGALNTYTTLAAWKAAATAQEPHSGATSTFNPQLVSAGGSAAVNYKLAAGSPMVGVGLNLSSLYSISAGSQDYFGSAIPNPAGFNVGADGGLPFQFSGSSIRIVRLRTKDWH